MFEREPITAGELMDKQFLPKPVIVEGMLPAGTYILAGTPKIGKSFLMTQLCWSVAEGIPFLGLATRKSTVLYLALEDTQERLQSRLARTFGTDWSGSEFHLLFQINQQGDALIQQFQDFILEHPDTRLIVIDTLQRVRESDGSSYSYSHDYETILPLKTFADAYDVALIVVHHTRKNEDDDNLFNQISGTNGLLGAADGAFLLHQGKNDVLLEQTGRDVPNQRYVLRFDKSRCVWDLIRMEHTPLPEPPDPLLPVIDQIIGKDGWRGTATELLCCVQQIAPDTELLPNTLTRKLNTLTEQLSREYGILFRNVRSSERRELRFLRIPQHDDDDANDGSAPEGKILSLPSFASLEGGDSDGE